MQRQPVILVFDVVQTRTRKRASKVSFSYDARVLTLWECSQSEWIQFQTNPVNYIPDVIPALGFAHQQTGNSFEPKAVVTLHSSFTIVSPNRPTTLYWFDNNIFNW